MLWLLFFQFASAFAACNNLRIQDLDNVDFTASLNPTETFAVRRAGQGGCSYFVTIDNGAGSSHLNRSIQKGADSIPVQIYSEGSLNQVLKNLPEVTSINDIFTGTFPEGDVNPKEVNHSIYPRMLDFGYQRFGRYEDEFVVRLYSGTYNGSYTLEDSDTIRLRYDVPKKIDLSLVSTGAPFDPLSTSKTLNFGTLSTGQQMGFDLVIKFNAGYRVRFSSQYNGNLRRTGFTNNIPYTLSMNGNPVALAGSSSNPVLVTQGNGVSGPAGLRFTGNITIGTVTGSPPGNYQDAVTITVSTTE